MSHDHDNYLDLDLLDLENPACQYCGSGFGDFACQANGARGEMLGMCLDCFDRHLRRDACEACLDAYPQAVLDEGDLRHCPRCLREPKLHECYAYTVACPNCFDGAPDSRTCHEVGAGLTPQAAIASWNDMVENWEEAA